MSDESTVSKQEQVVNLCKEGKWTRKEIIEKVGCTSGAFASYLSGMRNAAKFSGVALCPIEVDKDGKKVFTVDTFEAVEAAKEQRTTASQSAKTPEQKYAAAVKRVERAKAAVAKTKARHEEDVDNRENELYFRRAEIELELAEIDLNRTPKPEPSAEESAAAAEVVEDTDDENLPEEAPADDELV